MIRRRLILAAVVAVAFAGGYLGKRALPSRQPHDPVIPPLAESGSTVGKAYRRIVSLAPSITETMHALGLMDRVVGVTRYCDYPPEALARTIVGGYYDTSYEAIVALDPDLVIMLEEHEEAKRHIAGLGFTVLSVDHKSISGIMSSIRAIGKACGAEPEALNLIEDLRERMQRIREKTAGLHRPRTVISVGRNLASGDLGDVYISGRTGFYDEMITLAGGVNAYQGDVAFPVISEEGFIRMNPEVIIDMVPDLAEQDRDEQSIRREWEALSRVDGVRKGRVHVFGEDYVVIPGPRFILILEKVARAIHPEVGWE